MKRFLILCAIALALSGCATDPGNLLAGIGERVLNLPTGALTASIQNPITKDRLQQIEVALKAGVDALRAYKRLCESEVLPASCVGHVETMQGYVRQARPVLNNLRTFVKRNDQVNAGIAFTSIRALLVDLRATASTAGVPIPSALAGVQ